MIPYEEPTDELRQVRRTIDFTYRDYSGCECGLCPMTKSGTTDIVVSVQRKWMVADRIPVGAQSGHAIRTEWRDIPTYVPKAGEGGYV